MLKPKEIYLLSYVKRPLAWAQHVFSDNENTSDMFQIDLTNGKTVGKTLWLCEAFDIKGDNDGFRM